MQTKTLIAEDKNGTVLISTDSNGNIRLRCRRGSRVTVLTIADPKDGDAICEEAASYSGVSFASIRRNALRIASI